MIFVEPQNTDDWVNGTCPCDPRTDLSGVEDLRTLATETLLDELSKMGYDYQETKSSKDVLVLHDRTHKFFINQ